MVSKELLAEIALKFKPKIIKAINERNYTELEENDFELVISLHLKSEIRAANAKMPISETGMSVRVCNVLMKVFQKDAKDITLEEIVNLSPHVITKQRNFGKTCFRELKRNLVDKGLIQRSENDPWWNAEFVK